MERRISRRFKKGAARLLDIGSTLYKERTTKNSSTVLENSFEGMSNAHMQNASHLSGVIVGHTLKKQDTSRKNDKDFRNLTLFIRTNDGNHGSEKIYKVKGRIVEKSIRNEELKKYIVIKARKAAFMPGK